MLTSSRSHEVERAQLPFRRRDWDTNIPILFTKLRKQVWQIVHGAFRWDRDRKLSIHLGYRVANGAAGPEEALEAATSLKSHYCQWLDAKQWDRWSSLFTDDAVMQVGPNADSVVHGRRAIRKLLTTQLRRAKTLHQARNPRVHEESPGRLRVVWEMNDSVEAPLYLLEGAGFYEDRYVRTDDGWKIAGVRLHRSKVDLQPKSFAMRAILRIDESRSFGAFELRRPRSPASLARPNADDYDCTTDGGRGQGWEVRHWGVGSAWRRGRGNGRRVGGNSRRSPFRAL